MKTTLPFRGDRRPKPYVNKPEISFTTSLILFILAFCFMFAAKAQEYPVQRTPVAKAVLSENKEEITPLKIGDKIPDELWEMYFPVVSSASEQEQYLSLGDFKDKLIILDFWATWCSPCVAMIPVMDSLQKVFGDKMQFLSVTYQKKEEVLPFFAKLERVKEQKYHLPVLANDEHLRFVFPHTGLPHYVWIESGVVKSITGYEEVNARNIQASVDREEKVLKAKVDVKKYPYDSGELLFVNGNGGDGKALKYHTVFADYDPSLKSMYSYRADSLNGDKVSLTNHQLYDVFATSYDEKQNRLKFRNKNRADFEVEDINKLFLDDQKQYNEWMAKYGCSYEIKVPAHLNDSIYAMMRYDLKKLFPQYKTFVEERKTMCLVLIRTSKKDKIKSTSTLTKYHTGSLGYSIQNGTLGKLTLDLNLFQLQNSPFPIVDGTGYIGNVDITIEGNMSNVASINKALEKYDLKFIEEERVIEKLVIQDRN